MKDFKQAYKELARSKKLTRHHMVEYAILKALRDHLPTWHTIPVEALADIYIRKAFTPITRKAKLDNGREPMDTVYWTLMGLNEHGLALGSSAVFIFETDEELQKYKSIIGSLRARYSVTRSSEYQNRYYVYTFVRQDIAPEYQLVQAAHAAARMGHRQGREEIANDFFDELYFAVIGVANDAEMATAIKDCKEIGLKVYPFYEPDIGNVLTAFSTSPVRAPERKRLLSYKKLKFKNTTAK